MGRRCKADRSSVCEASCIDSLSVGAVVGSQIQPDKAIYVEKHSGSSKVNRAYRAGSIQPSTRASSKTLLRAEWIEPHTRIRSKIQASKVDRTTRMSQLKKRIEQGRPPPIELGCTPWLARSIPIEPGSARVHSGSFEAAQSSQPGRLARSNSKSLSSRVTRRLSSSLARPGLLEAA